MEREYVKEDFVWKRLNCSVSDTAVSGSFFVVRSVSPGFLDLGL